MKSTHTNTNTNKYINQLKEKVFTYHKVAEKNKIKEELEEVPGKLSPHPQIPKSKYKQVQTMIRKKTLLQRLALKEKKSTLKKILLWVGLKEN